MNRTVSSHYRGPKRFSCVGPVPRLAPCKGTACGKLTSDREFFSGPKMGPTAQCVWTIWRRNRCTTHVCADLINKAQSWRRGSRQQRAQAGGWGGTAITLAPHTDVHLAQELWLRAALYHFCTARARSYVRQLCASARSIRPAAPPVPGATDSLPPVYSQPADPHQSWASPPRAASGKESASHCRERLWYSSVSSVSGFPLMSPRSVSPWASR